MMYQIYILIVIELDYNLCIINESERLLLNVPIQSRSSLGIYSRRLFKNMITIITAMVAVPSISHVILLVLIQTIIINVVASGYSTQNATDRALPSRSGRSRRSLFYEMPDIIFVRVRYPTGHIVHLRWCKEEQYLANEHLPVVMSSGQLDQNIMDNIGEFVVYKDFMSLSSVVYFKKLDAFFGYIGMGYFITHLPYKIDDSRRHYPDLVGAPYVVKRSDPPSHIFPMLSDVDSERNSLESSNDDSVRGIKRPLDSDEGPSDKHQRFDRDVDGRNHAEKMNTNVSEIVNVRERRWITEIKQYYLEILVFVTRDIAEIFKSVPAVGNHIEWVVRYCLIDLNAIDMSFQSMRPDLPKLRMNIARIVIEDDNAPFEFMRNNKFQYPESAAMLRHDIETHKDIYTPDSFDHIFLITSLPIEENGRLLRAISESDTDLYKARKQNRFHSAVPLTILNYKTDYAVAVHEIGRTLSIEVDSTVDGSQCSPQCSGFMQVGSSKCDSCLKWSEESQVQYLSFTRNNRKRCFLMNEPRSLRPPGPSVYLSPYKQCSCFGYDFYLTFRSLGNTVWARECAKPLKCRYFDKTRVLDEDVLHPFDGTACANANKVCWNGQCVPYQTNSCLIQNVGGFNSKTVPGTHA